VVGASKAAVAKRLRELLPRQIFLVPGFGAQGGSADYVKACFNAYKSGAVITASRSVIFAYEKDTTGPWIKERWEGRLPDMRAVPNRPYRSSVERFPEPDADNPLPTLLVPLYSPPGLRRRQRLPLPPDSGHFTSRLAFELTTTTPPLMAMTLRSDAALERWEPTVRNLEHLARHPGMRFVTASDAVAHFVN
jgi:hypothetical protein